MTNEFLEAAVRDKLIAGGLTEKQADTAVVTVVASIDEVFSEYFDNMRRPNSDGYHITDEAAALLSKYD